MVYTLSTDTWVSGVDTGVLFVSGHGLRMVKIGDNVYTNNASNFHRFNIVTKAYDTLAAASPMGSRTPISLRLVMITSLLLGLRQRTSATMDRLFIKPNRYRAWAISV